MKFKDDDFDSRKLDQLIKALKGDLAKARIGILGAKSFRGKTEKTGGPTNAFIGMVHEFGLGGHPMRSFLRMPIIEVFFKRMEKQFESKVELMRVLKEGSTKPWVKRMAVLAEQVVQEAFDTGGFGKWPAWKTPGYTNDHGRLLEDTGQLRDSITSEVK